MADEVNEVEVTTIQLPIGNIGLPLEVSSELLVEIRTDALVIAAVTSEYTEPHLNAEEQFIVLHEGALPGAGLVSETVQRSIESTVEVLRSIDEIERPSNERSRAPAMIISADARVNYGAVASTIATAAAAGIVAVYVVGEDQSGESFLVNIHSPSHNRRPDPPERPPVDTGSALGDLAFDPRIVSGELTMQELALELANGPDSADAVPTQVDPPGVIVSITPASWSVLDRFETAAFSEYVQEVPRDQTEQFQALLAQIAADPTWTFEEPSYVSLIADPDTPWADVFETLALCRQPTGQPPSAPFDTAALLVPRP